VIYTGVTSNLPRRITEHQSHLVDGFTKKYNVTKLIYYEIFDSITDAIACEKQIKGGSRKKKIELIEAVNSNWRDLSSEL
jgi:putative endonuclease